ncbi:hypothetical protein C7T36_07450 [Rhodococcus sp. AD45-ID]|nr:hypothetical protein C7T36_07450 [Rhodococcus sp. AD45-ID]
MGEKHEWTAEYEQPNRYQCNTRRTSSFSGAVSRQTRHVQRRDTHPLRRGLSAKTKVTLIVLLVLALLLRPVLLVVLLLALIVTGLVAAVRADGKG